MLELPYKGDELSMVVLLPQSADERHNRPAGENRLIVRNIPGTTAVSPAGDFRRVIP